MDITLDWKARMEISDFASPLRQLIDRFRAWDATAGDVPEGDEAGLSHAARTALLAELHGIAGDDGARPPGGPWKALRGLFGPRASDRGGQRAHCESALLRGYEQLCELDLPFHLSSVLLRHYSLIKRAAHVADGRLQGPPSASGTGPRAAVLAVPR